MSLRAVTRGWPQIIAAACVAFLAMLVTGAVLLVAAKLQFPSFGAGFDPIDIVNALVIISLACLGVPIHLGSAEVEAFPLGALSAVGLSIAWASATAVRARAPETLARCVMEGAKMGLPFSILCWLVATIFRFRGGDIPVSAGAPEALILGALWGAIFGVVGGLQAHAPVRAHVARALHDLRSGSRIAYEGLLAGGVMLVVAAVLGAGAVLAWIIIGLAQGATPRSWNAGDAVAYVVYFIAFVPNLIVNVIALSMAAPVGVGARVTISGRTFGRVPEFSLTDWGGSDTPALLWLLLAIPLAAGIAGGMSAHRNAADRGRCLEVLGVAAVSFAGALLILALFSEARLGAGLVRGRGFGAVTPNAPILLALAAAWAGVVGLAGWKLAERRARSALGTG